MQRVDFFEHLVVPPKMLFVDSPDIPKSMPLILRKPVEYVDGAVIRMGIIGEAAMGVFAPQRTRYLLDENIIAHWSTTKFLEFKPNDLVAISHDGSDFVYQLIEHVVPHSRRN